MAKTQYTSHYYIKFTIMWKSVGENINATEHTLNQKGLFLGELS